MTCNRNDFFLGIGLSVISCGIGSYTRSFAGRCCCYFVRNRSVVILDVRIVMRTDVFCLRGVTVPNERIENIVMTCNRNDFFLGIGLSVISCRIGSYTRSFAGRCCRYFVRNRSVVILDVRIVMRADVFCLRGIIGPYERIEDIVVLKCRNNVFLSIGMSVISCGIGSDPFFGICRLCRYFVRNRSVVILDVRIVMRTDVFCLRGVTVPDERIEDIVVTDSGNCNRCFGYGYLVFVEILVANIATVICIVAIGFTTRIGCGKQIAVSMAHRRDRNGFCIGKSFSLVFYRCSVNILTIGFATGCNRAFGYGSGYSKRSLTDSAFKHNFGNIITLPIPVAVFNIICKHRIWLGFGYGTYHAVYRDRIIKRLRSR